MTNPERSRRLGDLYSRASKLEGAALAGFLDEECAGDPGLRRELEGLLALRNRTTQNLGAGAPDDDSLGGLPTPIARAIAECDERPLRIRQYRILDTLGEGGMGAVYLAEQTEPVRRRVALKVIKAGMYTEEIVARLEAERQALAIMNHPGIACFYDAGTTEDGHPYFAMEYVKGPPITEYCDRHRLSLRDRLELFIQVCHGVEHAHRRGVIHRDIKPGNVLVAMAGERPIAKIIDFGVAKAPTRRLTDKTLYTRPGRAVGTPAYMSPEQADRTTEEVDHRSDIYALGVLLYELLVGQLPLDLDDDALSFSEVVRRIREDDPMVPSRRWMTIAGADARRLAEGRATTATGLRGELRGELDWVTMKALEKEPARRYASASELASDIQRHLRDEPVLAGRPGTGYRLRRFVRRHRGAVAAVACVIVAFAIGQVANLIEFEAATRAFNIAQERLLDETTAALGQVRVRASLGDLQVAASSLDRGHVGEARRLLDECPEEFRSTWEWRHLRLRSDPSWLVLHGHGEAANPQPSRRKVVAEFSPDGRTIVSGGWDRTVRIWSVGAEEPSLTLHGHEAGVNAVAVSPDGSLIASGSGDRTVRLWDARSGASLGLLGSHDGQVSSVAFSPDGNFAASGAWDRTVRLWPVPAGTDGSAAAVVLGSHEREVSAVAFSPDRRSLASGGHDGAIRLWSLATRECRVLVGHEGVVWSLAFHPTGARLVSGSDDRTLRLWDVASGEEIESAPARESIVAVAFNGAGTRIAAGTLENVVQVWDAAAWTGAPLATLVGHRHHVWSVAFSPDGELIGSGSGDRTVRLWDAETRGAVVALGGHAGRVGSVAVRPDGALIASGSEDGSVAVRDATTGAPVASLKGHQGEVRCVSIGGGRVASASTDGTLRLWEIATGSLLVAPLEHGAAVLAAAFSPDGRRVVSGAADRSVRLWDAATGAFLKRLPGQRGTPSALAYSPDGGRVASASAGWVDGDLLIRVWEVESGEIHRALGGHTHDVSCVVFSPDGKSLASGSQDRDVRLWDIDSQESVALEGHEAPVVAVAFSPDGARLVSTAEDRTVRVWDVAAGSAVVVLGVDSTALSVVFGPDGARLVTGSSDGQVRVWESELSTARALWRGLSQLKP